MRGGWAWFETALGVCSLGWGEGGVRRVWLPGEHGAQGREGAGERWGDEVAWGDVPADVARAIAGMQALLRGERVDLGAVRVDLTGLGAFERAACEKARAIGPGRTATYGEVAASMGRPGAARAVGRAMGRNPVPLVVPCHRVVAASGRGGGYSAGDGPRTKLRLLAIEGAPGFEALELLDGG